MLHLCPTILYSGDTVSGSLEVRWRAHVTTSPLNRSSVGISRSHSLSPGQRGQGKTVFVTPDALFQFRRIGRSTNHEPRPSRRQMAILSGLPGRCTDILPDYRGGGWK
eukprot:GHVN01045634.1.p1 GENE.GHVN01045634.1~~GHVN01045634.1.p1  ORF type:complete len:108 (+),score=0.25 GHVN01045634.1:75-398(+)